MNTLYTILDIPQNASEEDIRKAYRRKAKLYHPDVNKSPNAQHLFVQIQKAYEILIDKHQRILYDQQFKPKEDYNRAYNEWLQLQKQQQEYERFRRYQEKLRTQAMMQRSQWYKLYVMGIYYGTILFLTLCIAGLGLSGYIMIKTHFIFLFILLPLICADIYVMKLTIDAYKKYRDFISRR